MCLTHHDALLQKKHGTGKCTCGAWWLQCWYSPSSCLSFLFLFPSFHFYWKDSKILHLTLLTVLFQSETVRLIAVFVQLFAGSLSIWTGFSREKIDFLFPFCLIFCLAFKRLFGWLLGRSGPFLRSEGTFDCRIWQFSSSHFFNGKTWRTHLKSLFFLSFFFSSL